MKSLLYKTLTKDTLSLRWGREHEEDARKAYMHKKNNIHLTQSGLVVDCDKGWLACSPDNFAYDLDSPDPWGLVEYKCTYSARETTVEEAARTNKIFFAQMTDRGFHLKTNHQYYYQIQGQMAICKRLWCDFVIWTPLNTTIERIKFNPVFWQETVVKLENFYDKAILPELVCPHLPQGQPIREMLNYTCHTNFLRSTFNILFFKVGEEAIFIIFVI